MRIRAAVTESKGAPFALQELDLGELRDDEVLVEVAAAGVCHTDLIIRDQWLPTPLPAVLGHEGAGIVRQVGSAVTEVEVGDRVGMSFNSCGSCPTCRTGRPFYCHDIFGRNFAAARPDGTTALSRDGEPVHSHFFGQSSFATHAVATERNVTVLPEAISLEIAAPLGCGVQTGAGSVLNAFRAPAGSTLAVFGTGGVGLSAVMAGVIAGCTTIIGVDIRPKRLELALELGATHVDRSEPAGRRRGDSADHGPRRRLRARDDGLRGGSPPGGRVDGAGRHDRRCRSASGGRRGGAQRQ